MHSLAGPHTASLGDPRLQLLQPQSTNQTSVRQSPISKKFYERRFRRAERSLALEKGIFMKTQKRFTPQLLDRFDKQGRGKGTFEDYLPWHRVGRGDPSSSGRSHLIMWRERQRELLSDGEWVGILFSTMLPRLVDVTEQYPLSLIDAGHEISRYSTDVSEETYLGTLEIALKNGIKHPQLTESGSSRDWQMTTDQVLVFKQSNAYEFLAIAYKPDRKKLTKRQRDLLLIEKLYWNERDVTWLLITPDLFEESVGIKLRETSPWGLGSPVTSYQVEIATEVILQTIGHTYTYTLNAIAARLGSVDLAQRSIWQGVWSSKIPIDLQRGWRPHLPIQLLSPTEFKGLNPIASRRSAWL